MNQLTISLFRTTPKAIVCKNPLAVSSSSSSSSFLENKIYCSLEQSFFHGAQFLLSSTSIDGGDHNVEVNQHLIKAFLRDMKSAKNSDHFSRGLPCL